MDVANAAVMADCTVQGASGRLEHGFENVVLVFPVPDIDMQIHSRTHGKRPEKFFAKPDIETVVGSWRKAGYLIDQIGSSG